MVEAACCVLLLGPLSHTSHSGFGAADGRPGEFRGGKRIALAVLLALPTSLRKARLHRRHPVTCLSGASRRWWPTPAHDSYLVDSASSHMLVSKIKPCMSKYKQLYSETANGSLYKLSFI